MLPSLSEWGTSLVFAATFLAVYIVYRSRDTRKHPPSIPWLPVVGSLPFLGSVSGLPKLFMEKSAKLGSVFAFYAGSSYIVVVNGRDAIHEALVKKSTDFADRPQPFLMSHYTMTDIGLIMRPYDAECKKVHQQSLSILKEFGFGKRIMESRIELEVSQLVELIKKKEGKPFNSHNDLTACIMNVTYSMLFGARLELSDPKLMHIFDVTNKLTLNISAELDIFPLLRYLPKYAREIETTLAILEELKDILNGCITDATNAQDEQESFVRMFINSGIDRGELFGVMRDLLLGGIDTSTTTLRWSLVLLANHPQVQERLHNEIDSVVPRDRFPALDDRPKLPYVEASIMELMRLKTLLPLALPHQTQCDTNIGGFFIPKDTKVIVNLYSAHMDPKFWKDPTVYRPERFLDNTGNITGKDLVIPFSLGKRSCLGEQLARQQVFLFYTGLLQHFEIRPPDGEAFIDDTENLRMTMFPSLHQVRLIPRL